MLDPSLKNLLIETIAQNIKSKEMDEIGKMLNPDFDLYGLAGKTVNMTIGSREGASILVNNMESRKKTADLIKLLAELDNNSVLGRALIMENYDYFLQQLTFFGYVYDQKKCKVVPLKNSTSDLLNWGALKGGRSYQVSIISLDIVGNSALVNSYGTKVMGKVYTALWTFLKQSLADWDGRIWTWAGDGGILAITFKKHVERAVSFAIELQRILPLFNMRRGNPISEDIVLRLGIHTGKVTFQNDPGQIVSDVVNLAAHLEKKHTQPGGISLTKNVYKHLSPGMQEIFKEAGDFEGVLSYQSSRMDLISPPNK